MQLPLSWIRDYVKPKQSVEKLAELLTLTGTEVERVEKRVAKFSGVVVGEVQTVIKHPAADRLKVTKVIVKEKQAEPLTIVCGAPNVRPGMAVPVALPGATLANGQTLEAATIRGVESQGMLCAPDELGLGDDHAGILALGPGVKLGTPLEQALALNDTIIHLELTLNRSDCFSVQGIAREIAAVTKTPFKPHVVKLTEKGRPAKGTLNIRIKHRAICSRYVGRLVRNVKVGPSPQWLVNRLEAAGVRPLNNVVDVTNYVMLCLGQPIHAFDARQVKGHSVVVRWARKGEKLQLLDGSTQALTTTIPVIADSEKPLAVAAIMGGEHSGVTEKTTTVIIESATFDPVVIRKASQQLRVRTEASHRHEKEPDPAMVEAAADYAAQLLAELAGGEVAKGRIEAGKAPPAPRAIPFKLADAAALLGVPVAERRARELLTRLGCTVKTGKSQWAVTPPSWRNDLRIPEDLTEEIGRLTGYNTFPKTLLAGPRTPSVLPSSLALERLVRDRLASAGFHEALTYPWYGQHQRAAFGLNGPHLELLKPLSQDQQYLRQSHVPRLTEAVVKNLPRNDELRLFELGSIFVPDGKVLREDRVLAVVALAPEAYRELRGVLETLAAAGGIELKQIIGEHDTSFLAGATRVATITPFSAPQARRHKIRSKHPYAALELSLTGLGQHWIEQTDFRPFSNYPAVQRDVAFWLPAGTAYGPIHEALTSLDPLLTTLELFDVFTKADRRSYAVRLTFQADDRTLTADEVEAVLGRVHTILADHGAELRL
ncbi:MAG: phenylalanine--tRNA ligase subunit beta [Candidatus Kerfeldbacteria bacterium]|nr:phenylalanine--tRNA ligase subunit beta [Candidatus Kerfeldbacteria bacterium]